MVITYFPTDWVPTQAYDKGDVVNYAGAIFELTATSLAGDADNKSPFDDQANWKLVYVNSIENIYSLISAVKLQLNTNNEAMNGSIPMAIRLAEQSIATHIRVPQQTVEEELTITSDSRVSVPASLVEVINVELKSNANGDTSDYNRFINNGRFEIIELSRYEYQRLKLFFSGDALVLNRSLPPMRSAGYWNDGEYFHFAPKLGNDSVIRVVYKAQLTPLGYPIQLTNADGELVNSAGETLEEWVADGNDADDFVIATGIQEINWYVQAVPRLIYFGTLMQMAQLLKDDKRLGYWEEQFLKAKIEAETLVARFEDNRPSAMYFETDYPLG